MDVIQISKFGAARRQIDVACQLFFSNEDPISIHTLTAASYNILRDINKGKTFLKDSLYVKEEHRQQLNDAINEAENFFKHADRDPEKILKFKPEQTELMLWEAIRLYYQSTQDWTLLMKAFHHWIILKYPEMITDSTERLKIEKLKKVIDHDNRKEFLEIFLQAKAK